MKNLSNIRYADQLVGLLYVALFAAAALWIAHTSFEGMETAGYDHMMRSLSATPSDRIAVIDIDDKSIEELGRMPWSRDLYERMNQLLENGGAKVVTYGLLFSEAQVDPGRDTLIELRQDVANLAATASSQNSSEVTNQARQIEEALATGINDLDYDGRLAASFESANNVVIPMTFTLGQPAGRPDAPLPDYISALAADAEPNSVGIPANHVTLPIESLATRAYRLGHLNQITDLHDGSLRQEALIVDYYGEPFPSLSLATAAAALNLNAQDIVATSKAVSIGPRTIPTDGLGRFNPVFYSNNNRAAFPVDSFTDVFAAKVPADKYRDKVVLIGVSARGVGDRFATPTDTSMSPAMVLAHTVSSILQGDSIRRPAWTGLVEKGLLAILTLYIIFLLPRLRSRSALIATGSIATIMVVASLSLFAAHIWLRLVTPLLFLLGGHLVMTIKRFGVVERLRANSDLASAESNRMLGLAFQSQGQLDMAFEKFRKCPLDDSLMEPMYTLALDFERKRQFNKAGAIYTYMAKHDPTYRDLPQRIKRNNSLDQTTILGQGTGVGATRLLIDDDVDGLQKPMLGRYMVEKEIGRGAMGTVYLGRDPKINRVVAIKTIALSEEFDEDDLATARDRFFREAETAGRLNHPDIVTVFDAGEELDLAYIAMEFLEGKELSQHTNQDNLLPVNTVLKLMARAAEALSYAHGNDVVHRDIKPANIMFDLDIGDIKITDFGIARITNSSKTKTGIVLGTPSYMSPEQLAGQTVTGKSDLFSLAVTLFQLLTGQLPFRADSMATLMYKIANDEHTPLHAVRPELPPQLEHVINTALMKDPADRYATGLEMAHDIRECLQHLAA